LHRTAFGAVQVSNLLFKPFIPDQLSQIKKRLLRYARNDIKIGSPALSVMGYVWRVNAHEKARGCDKTAVSFTAGYCHASEYFG
jgi:hypothetical protein